MSYPAIAYRTAGARAERRLSREATPSSSARRPIPMTNARKPIQDYKPRPDNFRANQPPKGLAIMPSRQLYRGVLMLLRLHPYFRAFMLGYHTYELLNWLMTRSLNNNGWILECNGPPSVLRPTFHCIEDNGIYNLCGFDIGLAVPNPCFVNPAFERKWGWYKGVHQPAGLVPVGQALGYVRFVWRNPNHPAAPPSPSPVAPSTAPQIWPEPSPLWRYPVMDPWSMPIGEPVPTPQPLPYPMIPNRPYSPEDFSDRGNSVPKGFVDTFAPNQRALSTQGNPQGRRPPRRNEKEKKFKAGSVIKGFATALRIGAVVDGKLKDLRDLVKAMHDSLPKELQLKGKEKKQLTKLMARTWQHLDKMDGSEAFQNILKEIAEDLLGGFGDKLRSEAATKNGWFKNKIFTSPRF